VAGNVEEDRLHLVVGHHDFADFEVLEHRETSGSCRRLSLNMYLAERMASTLEGTEFLPTPLSGLVIVHSISQAVSLLASSAGSEARAGKALADDVDRRRFEVSLTPLSPIFFGGLDELRELLARAPLCIQDAGCADDGVFANTKQVHGRLLSWS